VIVWPSPLDVSAYVAAGREVAPQAVRCPACDDGDSIERCRYVPAQSCRIITKQRGRQQVSSR
jgi:hypothetical protein